MIVKLHSSNGFGKMPIFCSSPVPRVPQVPRVPRPPARADSSRAHVCERGSCSCCKDSSREDPGWKQRGWRSS